MDDVEALGLLKMDFLGLRNLDVIDKAVELIGDLDIAADPDGRQEDLRDARARRGDRRLPVRVVGHARGAPAGEADRVRGPRSRSSRSTGRARCSTSRTTRTAKHGKEAVTYLDPRLKPILGATFGISVYQEQSMEIAKQIGGFTPAEADDLRKAIGKKIHALMASLKDKFIEGAVANATPDAVARQLWDDMEKAQDYSFNKSHAACYALISYRTAWLRANHAVRVHGRADQLRDEHEGPRPVLRQRVPRARDRGAAARRERVADRLRRRRRQDPLRPQRREGRGRARVPHDHPRARGGRPVRVALGLHRARRPVGREQARARVARQVRRAARLAAGDAARARAGARLRPEAAGRPARRPGLDLRRPASARPTRRARSTIRRSRRRSSRSPSCCGWRRRRSASTSPSTRSRRCAPSCARRPTRRSPSSSAAATASPSSSAGSSARSSR